MKTSQQGSKGHSRTLCLFCCLSFYRPSHRGQGPMGSCLSRRLRAPDTRPPYHRVGEGTSQSRCLGHSPSLCGWSPAPQWPALRRQAHHRSPSGCSGRRPEHRCLAHIQPCCSSLCGPTDGCGRKKDSSRLGFYGTDIFRMDTGAGKTTAHLATQGCRWA